MVSCTPLLRSMNTRRGNQRGKHGITRTVEKKNGKDYENKSHSNMASSGSRDCDKNFKRNLNKTSNECPLPKRQRTRNDGAESKEALNESTTTNTTTEYQPSLGLVRITSKTDVNKLQISSKTIIPLFPGAILGRNPKRSIEKHIDLGITKENGEIVSRKQLVVLSLDPNQVTLEQPSSAAIDSILYKRNRAPNKGPLRLRYGEKLTLRAKDQLIFIGKPKGVFHEFLVVHRRALEDIPPKPQLSVKTNVTCDASITEAESQFKVDDRIRLYYDSGEDFFGSRSEAGGWFFGTITGIESTAAADGTVELSFRLLMDDKVDDHVTLSQDNLEVVECRNDGAFLVSKTKEVVSIPATRTSLELGDLVIANFQNCGARYRGRVVGIKKNKRCHIAYDDGCYETDIPPEKVHLIERGRDNPRWLMGIHVGRTKVVSIEQEMVHFFSGKTQEYKEVVARLCAAIPRRAKRKLKWPHTSQHDKENEVTSVGASNLSKRGQQSSDKNNVKDAIFHKKNQRSIEDIIEYKPPEKLQEDLWRPQSIGVDSLDGVDNSKYHFAQKLQHEDEDKERISTEMHTSMANAFWKALNSSEPHAGTTMLTTLTTVHGQVPNAERRANLMELLTHGPKTGTDLFPDCQRMTLAQEYVLLLLQTQTGMIEKFAEFADANFVMNTLEKLASASTLCYCADGDESRTSSEAAIRRIGQSIQVHALGAKLLSDLLQGLLLSQPSSSSCRSFPMIRRIIDFGLGSVVKKAIETTVAIWMRHGRYIVRPIASNTPSSHLWYSLHEFLFVETKQLVDAMGTIVSSLVSFSSEQENGQSPADWSYHFRDALDRHSPAQHYVKRNQSATKELLPQGKYSKKDLDQIKLKLILSLDRTQMSELRMQLASLFGVEEVYSELQ